MDHAQLYLLLETARQQYVCVLEKIHTARALADHTRAAADDAAD
jgi:hypothetical protein